MTEQENNFEINLFEIDENSGFNSIIDELKDDDTGADPDDTGSEDTTRNDSKDAVEDVQNTEEESSDDANEGEGSEETEEQVSDNEGESEGEEPSDDGADDRGDNPSSVDLAIHNYIEKGYLLLPDDYEYEDNEEAIAKAFQDSETYRNQLAFTEAVKFLTSDKGLDLVQIKAAKERVARYSDIDVEKATDDTMHRVIEDLYRAQDFSPEEISEKIEDLVELGKVEKEFKRALGRLVKFEEKEIERQAVEAEARQKSAKEEYEKAKNLLVKTLTENEDFNGYVIPKDKHQKLIANVYTPVQLESGGVTTEFNRKLDIALNRADTFLVIAELLDGMTEKGFDFSTLLNKATTQATKSVKKTLRKVSTTSTKAKVSGKTSQSSSDFDLSKATLGFN